MKSPITGKEMTLKRECDSLIFRKEEFTFLSHFYLCEDSGEKFTSTELDELNLVQVHNQYRDKHNLPFPAELKAIRSKYGLSASKMSEILGLGANSYRHYENGEVPSNSNGRLIHLISDPSKFKSIVELCDTISSKAKLELIEKLDTLIQDSNENIFMLNMEQYLLGSSLPDSLTGYVKPNFLKFKEMVKFFAERIEPWKTVLNKLLFYSDFIAYKKNCFSMSGVRYRAIQMGPVPNNYNSIYDFIYNNGEVDIINIPFSDSVFGFKFKKMKNIAFNPELFDSSELDILEMVCNDFSKMNTNEVIEFSHKEKAWIENEKDRKLIDYKYAFEIDKK